MKRRKTQGKLTIKQKKYAKLMAENLKNGRTKTMKEIAREAGYSVDKTDSPVVAKKQTQPLLMQEIEKHLPPEFLAKEHAGIVKSSENDAIRLRGIELAYKFYGFSGDFNANHSQLIRADNVQVNWNIGSEK